MSDETTLERLLAEDRAFVFDSFDQATAWEVGSAAVTIVTERGLSMAVRILIGDYEVFKASVGGVLQDTDPWLEGKAMTVRHFDQASLLVRLRAEVEPELTAGLDLDVYRTHGGAVPIRVRGLGTVGIIATSGAPDRTDHAVATEALQRVILK